MIYCCATSTFYNATINIYFCSILIASIANYSIYIATYFATIYC